MFSFRSFLGGFVVGFGSGIAFRSLAERDFEPLREAFRTSLEAAQKVGDSFLDTYGRVRESAEDLWAKARAESLTAPASRPRAIPARAKVKAKSGRSRAKSRRTSAGSTRARELH